MKTELIAAGIAILIWGYIFQKITGPLGLFLIGLGWIQKEEETSG